MAVIEVFGGLAHRKSGRDWISLTLEECAAEIERLNEQINRGHSDRAAILREIDVVAPDDAPRIRTASYARLNPTAPIAGAGMGDN